MAGRVREDARRVKVCGLTGPGDARQAHAAGADLLGLVFADSPRRVDERLARDIRAAVPDGRLVGVFLDHAPDEVARLAAACDLDLIQLHGRESPAVCRELHETTGLPVIKALRPDETDARAVADYGDVAYFLVDRPKGAAGAAVSDQDLRAAATRLREAGHEVFLAGGLSAENVKEAAAAADPFGVDVSSGVESETGRKDHDAVTRFIREASR
jgi:phosphoribosylanthranilate isomerase